MFSCFDSVCARSCLYYYLFIFDAAKMHIHTHTTNNWLWLSCTRLIQVAIHLMIGCSIWLVLANHANAHCTYITIAHTHTNTAIVIRLHIPVGAFTKYEHSPIARKEAQRISPNRNIVVFHFDTLKTVSMAGKSSLNHLYRFANKCELTTCQKSITFQSIDRSINCNIAHALKSKCSDKRKS